MKQAWKPRWQRARRYLKKEVRMRKSESKRRGNIPLTKEFRMDMARVEIPVSGWTCLRTGDKDASVTVCYGKTNAFLFSRDREKKLTLVDVGRVGLLASLAALLLLARGSGGSLLAGLLLLSRSLSSWGLATSAGLLLGSFGRHF